MSQNKVAAWVLLSLNSQPEREGVKACYKQLFSRTHALCIRIVYKLLFFEPDSFMTKTPTSANLSAGTMASGSEQANVVIWSDCMAAEHIVSSYQLVRSEYLVRDAAVSITVY